MNQPHDPNVTTDLPSAPADPLHTTDPLGTTDHVQGSAKTDGSHPVADASAHDLLAVPGYRVLREIARGGMGCVLAAHDLALDRDVALKILLPGANADRFVRESKITARLPHPGIPPVHALGTLADGSPFLAMKLIAGQALADEMKTADRPRLLQAFTQVCQAVGFAHSRGIIHRDLKPANVMVGAFGEVQVMDWGLAKDLTSQEVPVERQASESRPASVTAAGPGATTDHRAPGESTDDQTQAGTVLGTPAYMAPEQARGQATDARADVFALGGILCALLTGAAPFSGKSALEVIQRAAAADLEEAFLRLDACGADGELVALCRRCLSPNPADRPADGQAVADGVTAYLDGVQEKLRQAELAQAEAKAKTVEEAKRRRLRLALVATVLLAVLGGGGGWLYVKSERDAQQAALAVQRVELSREANEALSKATTLREQARSTKVGKAALFAQAREQAQRARALVEVGPADEALAARVRQLTDELDDEEKDRKLVAALEGAKLAQAGPGAGSHFAVSENALPKFREAFRAFGMPPGEGDPAEVARRIKLRPVEVRNTILTALDEWVELSANRNEARAVSVNEPHREWLRAVLEAAEPDDAWTREFRAACRQPDAFKVRAALEKMAADADVSRLPPQSVNRLARVLEYVRAFESVVKLLRRAQRHHPADYWINYNLGSALQDLGPAQAEESIRYLTVAIALRPEEIGAHVALSMALNSLGRSDQAVEYLEDALARHPKLIILLNQLARVLAKMGKTDEAIARAREALQVDPNFAYTHSNLGRFYRDKGLVDEALASCRKAVELGPTMGHGQLELGQALLVKGRPDEAIPHLQRAIVLFQFLPDQSAAAYNALGVAFRLKGRPDDAIAVLEKAIKLDPRNADYYGNLGNALRDKGKLPEALARHQKAVELRPKNSEAYNNMGVVLREMRRLPEAIAAGRKAVELEPDDYKAHHNLGLALRADSQIDEAIKCYTKALAINPKSSMTHYSLGWARGKQGDTKEEMACYRKALECDPRNALALRDLGACLLRTGKVDDAIALHRKATEDNPTEYRNWMDLGNAITKQKGGSEEANQCFRKVLELNPKHAPAHFALGINLWNTGKREEAIASYRKAIELAPTQGYYYHNLSLGLGSTERWVEARDAAAKALELIAPTHPQRAAMAKNLAVCEKYVKVEMRLSGLISGKEKPASAQHALDAAIMCLKRKLPCASVRLFTAAFALDPRLADDLKASHRYNAACDAALAAAGQGKDATQLDDKERARLRKQARDWLRADLTAWEKRLKSGEPADRAEVVSRMKHWQQDSDFVGIRDREALAKLPEEERKAFTQLWADVAALRKQAETPGAQEKK